MSNNFLPSLNSDAGLAKYLNQIHKYPYLTADEEYLYAKQWSVKGDIKSAQKLVESHLRLVVKIAGQFRNYGLPMQDIISEGNLGLMHAVKKFDLSKKVRLSTYAMLWISSYIHDFVMHSWSMVKIGTTAAQKKLFFNLRRLKIKLNKLDDNALSPHEVAQIAGELNVEDKEVESMNIRLSHGDKSLNSTIGNDDEGGELINFIADTKTPEANCLEANEYKFRKELFKAAFASLSDIERDVINKRKLSNKPLTLGKIGKIYNLSHERIRQVEIGAMKKMQEFIAAKA